MADLNALSTNKPLAHFMAKLLIDHTTHKAWQANPKGDGDFAKLSATQQDAVMKADAGDSSSLFLELAKESGTTVSMLANSTFNTQR